MFNRAYRRFQRCEKNETSDFPARDCRQPDGAPPSMPGPRVQLLDVGLTGHVVYPPVRGPGLRFDFVVGSSARAALVRLPASGRSQIAAPRVPPQDRPRSSRQPLSASRRGGASRISGHGRPQEAGIALYGPLRASQAAFAPDRTGRIARAGRERPFRGRIRAGSARNRGVCPGIRNSGQVKSRERMPDRPRDFAAVDRIGGPGTGCACRRGAGYVEPLDWRTAPELRPAGDPRRQCASGNRSAGKDHKEKRRH